MSQFDDLPIPYKTLPQVSQQIINTVVAPGIYADEAAAIAGGVPFQGLYRLASGLIAHRGPEPDALAVITALQGLGVSPTTTQIAAIDAFHVTGKAQGWYPLLKRFYLPVWGAAGPNAVDWISRGSGTFAGTLTHSSGFVNSNGTTGYFSSDASPGQAGLTLNGSGGFYLMTAADSLSLTNAQSYFGASSSDANTRFSFAGSHSSAKYAGFGPNANVFTTFMTAGDQRGVGHFSRVSSTQVFTSHRTSTGETNSGLINVNSSALNNTIPMAFMARNFNGTISTYAPSTARFGSYGMTDGMDLSKSQAFTLALKTLWETCTGLTLP